MNSRDPRINRSFLTDRETRPSVRPLCSLRASAYNPGPGCCQRRGSSLDRVLLVTPLAKWQRPNSLGRPATRQGLPRRPGAMLAGERFARVLFPLSARVDFHHRRDGDRSGMAGSDERLSGGALNAAIANELGKLIADFTGRGATRSRAFVQQDLVVCVLEDGATRAERNLVAAGKSELVRWQRDALQHAMGPDLISAVEALTRRRVRTFLSGTDADGGTAIEAFVLEPEADGGPTAD